MSSVRSARPEDLKAIHELSSSALGESWSRDALSDDLNTIESAFFLVCESEEGIDGFIHWRRMPDEVEILNLAVWPEKRRQGVGRALLLEMIRKVRFTSARAIFLEVRESNLPAQSLYVATGFSEVARRPGYYDNPCESALILRYSFVKVS